MDTSTIYDMSVICRICMQEDDELFSIFNELFFDNKAITIAEIIAECTRYPVVHNDQLPTQICKACKEAARNAYKFKKQTEDAYRHLKVVQDISRVSQEEKSSRVKMVRFLTADKYTQTEKGSVFQCEICTKKFFAERELREHRANIHINDGKKCRVCGVTFNHLGQLKVHLSAEHPSEGIRCDFKCNICSRGFTRGHHLKRHLIRVHKVKDIFNITKVSLDEQEIENHTVLSASLNNFNNHWPDYQEEDDNEPINSQQNETVTDTDPFSKDVERLDYNDFSNMDEEVKQFAEAIAHSEISIKAENPDVSYNISSDENDNKSIDSSFGEINSPIAASKPEKSIDKIKEICDEEDESNANNSIIKHHNNNTSSEDVSENGVDDDNFKSTKKPKRILTRKHMKQPHTNVQNPISSTAKPAKQDNRCKECNRTFTRYNHMLRHMLTHSDEKPHVCNICSKKFSRLDNLKKHIQSLHCEKNYKCDQCSSAYGREDHLQKHIEMRHNKECDMCEKKFTTKADLAKHKLIHTGRPYICKHCLETFQEKEQMKEHQKTKHAPARNFLCNICGDSFQGNKYLKIHMRRHTGEKPYKCSFCEKGFPRSTDLKMHERYHMGYKPNLCNLCGKGFHRPYNLNIHMRTHTGEKPYKCNQCSQAFAQSNDLKAHIRRHTGERFHCELCSAEFLQRYGLNAHLRTVHGKIVTAVNGRLVKTNKQTDGAEVLKQQAPANQKVAAQEQSQ